MKTTILFGIFILFLSTLNSQSRIMSNFYDFTAQTIDGKSFDFKNLKGKKVLIVNTASECGYTPQYKELEELYKNFGGDNFEILGFPSNDFGAQEPGNNDEIKAFCTKNYGVSFQMMSKISVIGPDIHPLYKWLTLKAENGKQDAEVKWNFQKFLIDADGHWIATISHKESPVCVEIIDWLEN
jgi:glutathione peroxidase